MSLKTTGSWLEATLAMLATVCQLTMATSSQQWIETMITRPSVVPVLLHMVVDGGSTGNSAPENCCPTCCIFQLF